MINRASCVLSRSIRLCLKQMDNSVRAVRKTQKIWKNKHMTVPKMLNLVLNGNKFMATFRKYYCVFRIRQKKNKVNGGCCHQKIAQISLILTENVLESTD